MLHSSTTLSTLEYFSSRPTQTDRLMTVEAKSARKLLLILLDGARWDYEQKFNMKNLEKIRLKGFSADELQPCYPTMSAPNFYSAVTGKYPGNHGLINNKMFDAVKNVEFASFANPPDPICLQEMWWRAAEPIWISAAKKKLNVHMFRWFGSTIARDNIVPKLSSEYVEGYPVENMEKDLLEAINLFIDDESDFIGFYVGAIDDAGHSSGPESMEMKEACKIVDENLGMLLELLETKKDKYGRLLKNEVNTIIFSDHGMTQLDSQKVVDIHAVLDRLHPKHHILLDCTLSIWTENDDHTNQIVKELSKIPHMNVFTRQNLPDRFHLSHNERVGAIYAYTDLPYVFHKDPGKDGNHGFDNAERDMQGILYGFGPDIKENIHVSKVSMVDLYPLLAQILNLKALDCDGRLEKLSEVLKTVN